MSESTEQQSVVTWFRFQYPHKIIYSNNNAIKMASRAKNKFALLANLKKEGVLKGVSDLTIAEPVGEYHGMYLEMKDKGKTYCSVTQDQRQFISDMKDRGYYATWAAGFEEARQVIIDYLKGKL